MHYKKDWHREHWFLCGTLTLLAASFLIFIKKQWHHQSIDNPVLMTWFLKYSVIIQWVLLWTTTFKVLWFNYWVLWNNSQFHIYLNVLTYFMIAFYYVMLNILKSYAIFSCFWITKVEGDPRQSIHDNHLPYFCVPEMCWLRFWCFSSILWTISLCNRRLVTDVSHNECLKRRKWSNFPALLVLKPHLYPLDTSKHYR